MKHFFSQLPRPRLARAAQLLLLLVTAGAAQAQQTTYFLYTGGYQTYTVPAGVSQVDVVAAGGFGGTYSTNGFDMTPGAQVQARLTVVPGEVLTVVVGGQGSPGFGTPPPGGPGLIPGGFNGGGVGNAAGSGGGATDLRRSGTSTGDYLTGRNALLVAGGSGGSYTANYPGGRGGIPNGGDGRAAAGLPGTGATSTGPGGGGTPGANDRGGDGSFSSKNSGGGGGGYYGGGGVNNFGGGGAGGGGGSSYVMPSGSSGISYGGSGQIGDGMLTITPVVVPVLTSISPAAELPGADVILTGTNFTPSSRVTFGGVGASVGYLSPTSLSANVPTGAAAGPSSVVVTNNGSSSSGLAFTVLAVYDGSALDACTAAVPATASVNDGAWHFLLSGGGQVVAAYQYTGASLGTLAVDVLRTNPAAPVRQDAHNHYYLDRNFHLAASAGSFPGRTVGLRLYGLSTEFVRLQAADASVTPANLKATQYSGPNEDCDLGNDSPTGERRVLAAPAIVGPQGASWFRAELSVADHFSEFYLTGSNTPLPVELTAFTATADGPAAVRLAWATASEQYSARFEVERSANGTGFAPLGSVAAAGTSTAPHAYGWRDERLPLGAPVLYYRLRQVDADGTFSYSPVRPVVLVSVAKGLALSPNPAPGGVATLTGAAPGTVIQVFDALGRPVISIRADAAGTAPLALPDGQPAGMYLVRAGTRVLRLVVE